MIDRDLQGQIWLQSQISLNSEFEVCPHDNSSLIQAGITKLGAEVQNAFLEIPTIVFGSDHH